MNQQKKGGKTFELDIGKNSIVFFNGQLEHGIEKISSKQNIPRIAIYPMQAYFANQENFPRALRLLFKSFLKMKRIWSKDDTIKQGLYIDKQNKINTLLFIVLVNYWSLI